MSAKETKEFCYICTTELEHLIDPMGNLVEIRCPKCNISKWRKAKKHSTFCWNCGRPFEYDGEQYCDVPCSHCGVMNSIYDPGKFIPSEEE